ncbi:hypothetical protein T07_2127 [Trichinella nelsoni]|uniref:Uncharacterized protein n=1 Tax=Trichinella nelsoni TaxID=6336 RepID=A0A0V0SDB1_9BILA|nr:hypothetical protein T07_2127 [Trichinella nelsoni]
MVDASHVAQLATPSLKQHPYPAEEVILRKKRIDVPFEEDSHVKNGASTSGQLAEQKQIKKWMALKTTDTKGKTPAMGRAHISEDLLLNLMPFITLSITLHSDEPP